jgi:hypothetical protein
MALAGAGTGLVFEAPWGLRAAFTKRAFASQSKIPAAADKDEPALLDSLPHFLDTLIDSLRYGDRWRDKVDEAKLGAKHGLQRFQLRGYTLRQVIEEYHVLRYVLIDTLLLKAQANFGAVTVINAAVDRGITNAADVFAALESEVARAQGVVKASKHAPTSTT